MTKILIDEATVKQALDALEFDSHYGTGKQEAITALREALASEAIEQPAQQCKWPTCQSEEAQQALAEQIKRELVGEQPAQQEPVAWRYTDARGYYRYRGFVANFDKEYPMLKPQALYTSPQPAQCAPAEDGVCEALNCPNHKPAQRKPLTEEEFEVLHHKAKGYVHTGLMDVVRIVEHHHNIKEQP